MMWNTNKLLACAAAWVLGLGAAGLVAAENSREIGSFGKWIALTFEDDGKPGCYVIAEPDGKEGKYASRGKVYALVTHRPADKELDVVTVIAGYTFKDESTVTLQIGVQTFELVTAEGMAWADDEDDPKIVEAMKKGEDMVIKGVSSRGTETTDSYSLSGFTKAYNAIGKACDVGN